MTSIVTQQPALTPPADSRDASSFFRRAAVIGGLIWLALRVVFPESHTVHRVVALAPLFVTPLALSLSTRSLPRTLRWLMPAAGLSAATACMLPLGVAAGVGAAGWLAWCGSAALAFALPLYRARFTATSGERAELAFAFVIHSYLAVGAAWLLAARAGISPLGFGPVITTLTAAHFHYAGFGAPLLLLALARRVPGPGAVLIRRCVAIHLGATIGVAIGLSTTPIVSLVPVALLAAAIVIASTRALVALPTLSRRPLTRVALFVSLASPWLSMPLALAWSLVRAFPSMPIPLLPFSLSIDWMIRLHGMANAHGFVTLGLVALVLDGAWPVRDVTTDAQARSAAP